MDLLNKWYTVCGTRCRGSLSVCVNETLGLWTGTPVRNLGAKLKEALTPVLTLHLNDPENEAFLNFGLRHLIYLSLARALLRLIVH